MDGSHLFAPVGLYFDLDEALSRLAEHDYVQDFSQPWRYVDQNGRSVVLIPHLGGAVEVAAG